MSYSLRSSLLVCFLTASLPAQVTWVDRTAEAGLGGILHAVAHGDGNFVAVGTNSASGVVVTSPDGISWTDRTSALGVAAELHGVAHGDGRFVAVGTNTVAGVIASSPDGAAWTDHTAAAGVGGVLHDVAHGNGNWVAVGYTGGTLAAVATSPDGVTWTNRSTAAGVGGQLHGITHAAGQFVAVGTNGSQVVFATSATGEQWTVHTSGNTIDGAAYAVTHDGAQFIATGDANPAAATTTAHVLTSVNGSAWTLHTLAAGLGGRGNGIAHAGGTTVLVGRTGGPGLLATSPDAITWANRTATVNAPGDLRGVVEGNGTWVAVGTNNVAGVVLTSAGSGGSAGDEPAFTDDGLSVPGGGGSFSLPVTAGDGVDWTATADEDWVFLSNASGTGDGTVTGSVGANTSANPRSAIVTVGTDTLVLSQVGATLTAPSLTGFFDASAGAVSLRWNHSGPGDGYDLQRAPGADGAFEAWQTIDDRLTRATSDEAVAGGMVLRYRVRAVERFLASPWSNVVTVEVPPDIPDDLVATPRHASRIELTWTDVSGERGYLLFRAANDETFFQEIAQLPPDETRYLDSGLEAGSLYRYQIEAESSSFGRRSAEAVATTPAGERTIVWASAEIESTDYFAVAEGDGTVIAVGTDGRVTRSTDGLAWNDVSPRPTGATLRAVAFAAGRFVAVGDGGTILHSPDGDSWAPASVPTAESLTGVAFLAGQWFAVGSGGALFSSSDGTVWNPASSPAEEGFVALFAGERLVAVEGTGRLVTSVDGVTWAESRTGTPPAGIEPFFWTRTAGAFGDDTYSVVGPNSHVSSGTVMSAGIEWSEGTDGGFNYWEAVAYGGGGFVAVGLNGRTGYSSTGQSYFEGESQGASLYGVAHTPYGFVAVGARGLIVQSPDGIGWTERQEAEGSAADFDTIGSGGGRLVAFGEADLQAVVVRNVFDGEGWREEPLTVSGLEFLPRINAVAYLEGRFVAVGAEGLILTSPDGATWTARRTREPGPFNDNLHSVAGDGEQWLAAGGNDPLLRSVDNGLTWSPVGDLPDGFTPWRLLRGPRWVGHFGGSGTLRLRFSDDGSAWEPAWVSGAAGNVSALALGTLAGEPLHLGVGSAFGGSNPQAMVSWDGRNWHARAADGFDGEPWAVAYGSGLFLAVGSSGAHVWASLDGVQWEPAPSGFLPPGVALAGGLRDLTYLDGVFYAVGSSGVIVALEVQASDALPGAVIGMVEATVTNGTITLRWPSQVGYLYEVVSRPDLAAGGWATLGSPQAGTGGMISRSLPLSSAERSSQVFFAVRATPDTP